MEVVRTCNVRRGDSKLLHYGFNTPQVLGVTSDDVLSDGVQLADEILVVIVVPMASFVHVKRVISSLLVDISSL